MSDDYDDAKEIRGRIKYAMVRLSPDILHVLQLAAGCDVYFGMIVCAVPREGEPLPDMAHWQMTSNFPGPKFMQAVSEAFANGANEMHTYGATKQ